MKNSYSLIKTFFLVVGIVFVLVYFLFSLTYLVDKWIETFGFLFIGIGVGLIIFFPLKYSTKPQFFSEYIIKNVTISGKKFNFLSRIILGMSFICYICSFSALIYGFWVAYSDYIYLSIFLRTFASTLLLYFFTYLWTLMYYSSRKKNKRKEEIREAHISEIRDWFSHNDYIINDENINSLISLISDFNTDSRKNIDRLLKVFPEVQNQFPEMMKKVKKEVKKVKSGKKRNQEKWVVYLQVAILFTLIACIISALHYE